MRYVSPETRLTGPEAAFEDSLSPSALVWERVRATMSGGRLWSVILVLLLIIAVTRSTATVRWVDGIDVITAVALAGGVLMGALALSPVRDFVSLAIGLVLAPVAAVVAAWPQLHARHPTDLPGLGLVGVWWQRLGDGSAVQDASFYLLLICLLMWVTGAWLAWCVLRWRKPMLGLIPGAAAFATNVLNFPQDQNGYTLAILVLTLALLLWSNYTGSIVSAERANVKLTGDARWDFWESGLVAMAALIVLGIMLPPLSTVDRTLDVESGLFTSWAQLQDRLSHPGVLTSRAGAGGFTGFSEDVKLNGALTQTLNPVFTYVVIGDYAGPRYFRGVNETLTQNGEWRYAGSDGLKELLPKDQQFIYGEDYQKLAGAGVRVHMLHPPVAPDSDVLFYPGVLYSVDRPSIGIQAPNDASPQSSLLYSLDRLSSIQPSTSAGTYLATVEYSTATTADLQGAGLSYPDWIKQYAVLPGDYRPPFVLDKIHALAQSIVDSAGAKNPYDMSDAIQTYLRNPSNFTYTLDARPPEGRDRIDWFLFTSRQGYCEFFATAMGDMLRSLGIPTRLVNGFGPGTFDTSIGQWVVRGADAHTWVEVYFPKYGWIPFEPTPDSQGVYQPILRGQTGANPCLRDNGCDVTGVVGGGLSEGTSTAGSTRAAKNLGGDTGQVGGGGIHVGALDSTALMRLGGVLVAILLLLLVLALRYLRPRTVMAVWKRTLTLSRLAGAQGRAGETPLELGRRLRRTFPEIAEPISLLADGFVVAAYAPPEDASTSRMSVMEAWSSLRPMLLRRVLSRLRPTRP